jgi:subtilisin family serine protease
MREYVVTLKNYEDLEKFYSDMETEGGSFYTPERTVDLTERRPLSRNTHYNLTDEEAIKLQEDPRVESVELSDEEIGAKIVPLGYLTTHASSFWSKSNLLSSQDLNWGLLRCYEGSQRTNWGTGTGGINYVYGKIDLTNIGRNVDVVIVDGIIDPAHPEFSLNPDGTGGSRVIRYNWYQHNPTVKGTAASVYPYNTILNDSAELGSNDHGYHVAGTAVGNTLGWARGANIYNIYAYLPADSEFHLDYIREFHRSKAVNPVTGVKNPTIINMSYTLVAPTNISEITSIRFRNQIFNRPVGGWTLAQRQQYGLNPIGANNPASTSLTVYIRTNARDADLNDLMNDGVICLGAAGNEGLYIDVPTGPDYDNAFVFNNTAYFYHRGPSQGGAPRVICVGAVDVSSVERKAVYSNTGPRIDVFSPGTQIMSSYKSRVVPDLRDNSYSLNKSSGTSMATPQVCGILACVLEIFPHLNQEQAMAYVKKYATKNDLTDYSPTNFSNYYYLNNANNYYAKFRLERELNNVIHPKTNFYQFEATQDRIYPRPRIRRYG